MTTIQNILLPVDLSPSGIAMAAYVKTAAAIFGARVTTYAGLFRRMLLGSMTAKVLNDADCPVLTTQHAETISPRQREHREWVCAIGLDSDSPRVLRYASQVAESVHANLTVVHVIPASGPDLPVELDLTAPFGAL